MASFITGPLSSVGLNTPASRTLAGAVIGMGIVVGVKPGFAFNENGSYRPWALTSGDPSATYFPWFSLPLGIGAAFGVLL